jgi:hypothetical protein
MLRIQYTILGPFKQVITRLFGFKKLQYAGIPDRERAGALPFGKSGQNYGFSKRDYTTFWMRLREYGLPMERRFILPLPGR